jgi:hypothetical protein
VALVAVEMVGADGAPDVIGLEAADARPVPAEFVALTVKVYDVPAVKPETVHDVDPVAVHVWLPLEVTV